MAILQILTKFLWEIRNKNENQTAVHQTGRKKLKFKLKIIIDHPILKSKDGVELYYCNKVLW